LRAHASQRLDLGERGPLGVDREPPTVGQPQAELHDLAVHPEVGGKHRRRELAQVLAEHVLAGPPLRVAAGEDVGEPPDHLLVLGLRRATLLVPHLDDLEDLPCGVEAVPEVIGHAVPLPGGVRDPPELRGLHLQPPHQLGLQLCLHRLLGLLRLHRLGFAVDAGLPAVHQQRAESDTDARRQQGHEHVVDHRVISEGGMAQPYPGRVTRPGRRTRNGVPSGG
jgi:hypothetical protein